MYFEDLTPYTYYANRLNTNVVNIGWLSINHEFKTGKCSELFIKNLIELRKTPQTLMRGSHLCEWCLKANGGKVDYTSDSKGNGEIHIVGEDGIKYVAPVLILHYIQAHNYLPPKEFIEAVEQYA